MDGPSEEVVAALPPDRVRNAVVSLVARPRVGAGRQARSAARGACRRRGRRDDGQRRHPAARSASRSTFSVLRDDVPLFPKIKLYDREGDTAFNALDSSDTWDEPPAVGDHVSTVWIPANLLNEGLYMVDVTMCSLGTVGRAQADPPRRRARSRLLPRVRPGRRRLVEGALPRAPSRSRAAAARVDDRAPLGATAMEIVGVMLVHNEDVFVERALRNMRRASATGSTSPTTCRPTRPGRSWRRSRASSTTWTPCACGRPATRTPSSRAMRAPTPGCSGSTATSSTIPPASPASASDLLGGAHQEHFSLKGNVLHVTELDRAAGTGERLPRAAVTLGDEALQLRRHRLLDAVLPPVHARRRDRVPAGLLPRVARPARRAPTVGGELVPLPPHVLPHALEPRHARARRSRAGRARSISAGRRGRARRRFSTGCGPRRVASAWKEEKYRQGELVTKDVAPFFP